MAYVTESFKNAVASVLNESTEPKKTVFSGAVSKTGTKDKNGNTITYAKWHEPTKKYQYFTKDLKPAAIDESFEAENKESLDEVTKLKQFTTEDIDLIEDEETLVNALAENQIMSSRIRDKLDAMAAEREKKFDNYDFSDLKDKDDLRRERGGVKVIGTYGKSAIDTDDDETVTKTVMPQEKRGRGRPRKNKF